LGLPLGLLLDCTHSLRHMRHMSSDLLREGLKPFGWIAVPLTIGILTIRLYLVTHCDVRLLLDGSSSFVTFVLCVLSLRSFNTLVPLMLFLRGWQRLLGPMKPMKLLI